MKISVFAIILLIYLLANYYILQRIWVALPPNNTPIRIALLAMAAITISSFFISALAGESLPIGLTSILYKIGASWMFITIFFVLFFLFQDVILFFGKHLKFIPPSIISQYSRESWMTLLFTFSFIALLIVGGYLRYKNKVRIHIPIQFSKSMSDSISDKRLRIVAISDLHLGYTIGKSELEDWIELINKENPDIILIAGDLIDNSLRPLEAENIAKTLKTLKANKGVYACLGNHEYISGVAQNREKLKFFEKANIRLLRDDYTKIDSTLYIVGRDDRANKNRKELPDLIKNLDKTKPIILLDHQPYDLNIVAENDIDLQISGHTHQGQVWPISLITKMLYEIDHGFLRKGDTAIYVSSGIGLWGGKFRIGTQSEYVVIDIN